jgi:hypothetical protein
VAGVARSHNFYPMPPMRSEDGLAAVALGLGEIVVDGGACFRFCPRYPRHLVQFSSVPDTLANAQREFYALELGRDSATPFTPRTFDLAAAEEDGTLARVGSTYSPENDMVYDGTSRAGVRLVTFAPILKHGLFPLAELIDALLRIAVEGTNAPVEMEFAARLSGAKPADFGVVQLRPLGRIWPRDEQPIPDVDHGRLICSSGSVLGHGTVDDVRDLVVLDVTRFDRFRTREIAGAVGQLNADLCMKRRPYALIGVGAAMASGSQKCSGSCADLPHAAIRIAKKISNLVASSSPASAVSRKPPVITKNTAVATNSPMDAASVVMMAFVAAFSDFSSL